MRWCPVAYQSSVRTSSAWPTRVAAWLASSSGAVAGSGGRTRRGLAAGGVADERRDERHVTQDAGCQCVVSGLAARVEGCLVAALRNGGLAQVEEGEPAGEHR